MPKYSAVHNYDWNQDVGVTSRKVMGLRRLQLFRGKTTAHDRDSSGAHLVQWNGGVAGDASHRVPVVVRRRRPPTTSAGDEELDERVAKLLAHGAVEQEVDAVVYQSQNVQQVAETRVHFVDEVRQQTVEEIGHTLRELGDEEEDDDQEQHAGGTGVGSSTAVVSALAATQHLTALLGDLQRANQQNAEYGQPAARNQLHEQRLDPEVEQVHELIHLVLQFERHHPRREPTWSHCLEIPPNRGIFKRHVPTSVAP